MRECNGCGTPEPVNLTTCPYCGNDKCERCDMGDDVECGSCHDDLDDWDADLYGDLDDLDDDWDDDLDDIDF